MPHCDFKKKGTMACIMYIDASHYTATSTLYKNDNKLVKFKNKDISEVLHTFFPEEDLSVWNINTPLKSYNAKITFVGHYADAVQFLRLIREKQKHPNTWLV